LQVYALRALWQCWLAAGYVWSGGDYGVVENLHMHMMLTTWLMGCTYSVFIHAGVTAETKDFVVEKEFANICLSKLKTVCRRYNNYSVQYL
jgi:hypothetical protein